MFLAALDHYCKVNGKPPEKIIIYRDGISDGQLPLVTDYEIPQISSAFEMVGSEYKYLNMCFFCCCLFQNFTFFFCNKAKTSIYCCKKKRKC